MSKESQDTPTGVVLASVGNLLFLETEEEKKIIGFFLLSVTTD